jgi:hypothetical protein
VDSGIGGVDLKMKIFETILHIDRNEGKSPKGGKITRWMKIRTLYLKTFYGSNIFGICVIEDLLTQLTRSLLTNIYKTQKHYKYNIQKMFTKAIKKAKLEGLGGKT